jgi:hypothetical protein
MVMLPRHRVFTPGAESSPWNREEATGIRRTRQIGQIPSIILIDGASIIVIALSDDP